MSLRILTCTAIPLLLACGGIVPAAPPPVVEVTTWMTTDDDEAVFAVRFDAYEPPEDYGCDETNVVSAGFGDDTLVEGVSWYEGGLGGDFMYYGPHCSLSGFQVPLASVAGQSAPIWVEADGARIEWVVHLPEAIPEPILSELDFVGTDPIEVAFTEDDFVLTTTGSTFLPDKYPEMPRVTLEGLVSGTTLSLQFPDEATYATLCGASCTGPLFLHFEYGVAGEDCDEFAACTSMEISGSAAETPATWAP